MPSQPFEPKIVAFLCTWCSYRAADEVGRARHEYSAAIRIIRVPCSGRVDPQWALLALERGADGVLVVGCPKGACHFKSGNVQALKRFTLLQHLLREMGVDPCRIQVDWAGVGDGDRLLAVFTDMVRNIRILGPLSPWDRPLECCPR